MKKIIYNKFIPFKGYVAINLFGIIFARKEYKAQIENNYRERYKRISQSATFKRVYHNKSIGDVISVEN